VGTDSPAQTAGLDNAGAGARARAVERPHPLTKAGIGSVLDVRSEASDDEAELAKYGLRFLHLPIDDFHAPSQEQLTAGAVRRGRRSRLGA
jgi:hypothetical protein